MVAIIIGVCVVYCFIIYEIYTAPFMDDDIESDDDSDF